MHMQHTYSKSQSPDWWVGIGVVVVVVVFTTLRPTTTFVLTSVIEVEELEEPPSPFGSSCVGRGKRNGWIVGVEEDSLSHGRCSPFAGTIYSTMGLRKATRVDRISLCAARFVR